MSRSLSRLGWLPLLLVLGAWDPVTKKQADVAQGNQKLAAGKADEAEKHYQKALGELGPSPEVLYDLGAAHYAAAQALPPGEGRKKLLESAEKELRLAGDAPETPLRSSAHYNLGNTLFAEEKYKDAIEEYKKSLRLQPEREDARHNLELALARLPPPQPQKPQPQPQKDPKQDPKNDPQKQQAADQPQPSDDQKQDQKDQGQPDQKDQKDQQQANADKPDPQKDPKNDPQGTQQKPDPQKPGDENKPPQPAASADSGDRDTDRKLDLLEDKSKDLQVQKAHERARERRRGQAVKDW